MKHAADLSLDSFALLHIHHAVSHGFQWDTLISNDKMGLNKYCGMLVFQVIFIQCYANRVLLLSLEFS